MCYKNTLVQGWGVRPKRILDYRGGWEAQKWPFWGVRTLWMAPNLNFSQAVQISGLI